MLYSLLFNKITIEYLPVLQSNWYAVMLPRPSFTFHRFGSEEAEPRGVEPATLLLLAPVRSRLEAVCRGLVRTLVDWDDRAIADADLQVDGTVCSNTIVATIKGRL